MKIVILNGSPKAHLSVTLQSMNYLQLKNPEADIEQIHLISAIRKGEHAIKEAIKSVTDAGLVLWSFPLYHMLVPGHMKRFIEKIYEHDMQSLFSGKYTSVFTTSIHFYDNTAHEYMEGICNDLGMKYLPGLSHDMSDMTVASKRGELEFYFNNLLNSVKNSSPVFPKTKPLTEYDFDYKNTLSGKKIKTAKRTVVVTDAQPGTNISHMVDQYVSCIDGPIQVVDLNKVNMNNYCIGCCNCAAENICVHDKKDDYRKTLDSILDNSDIVVYASELKDRYFSSKMKTYFDRTFCYTHIPIFAGKQITFLTSGAVRELPHMNEIMYAYASESSNLGGIVSDECQDSLMLDALIHETASNSVLYAEKDYIKTEMFQAVGAKKIFSDAIEGSLGSIFLEDYKYYKAHNYFKKPSKVSKIKNAMFRLMMSRKPFQIEVNKNMYHHMLSGHKKVLESISN